MISQKICMVHDFELLRAEGRTIKPHSRTSMFLSNWGNLVMEVRLTSLHQFLFIYVASTVHNQIRELCTTMIWCTALQICTVELQWKYN